MVRRNVFIAGVVLGLGSLAVTALAQGPGGGGFGGGMGGGMFGGGMFGGGGAVTNLALLRITEVRTELTVTADQQTKLTALIDESNEKLRNVMSGMNFQDMQSTTRKSVRR